jgi:hypothetical protein
LSDDSEDAARAGFDDGQPRRGRPCVNWGLLGTAAAVKEPRSGRRSRHMLAYGAVRAQTGRVTSDRPGRFVRSKAEPHSPDILPVLSRGRHRNPRKGACFMELASYLAGERWSDHPTCTHSLLASVARLVNDHTSDGERPRLAELIPSVIGLIGDDPHIDALITLRCSTIALPVAAADRQRVLAVSVLVCEKVLAQLDGRWLGSLTPDSERVLRAVPHATQWAYRFTSDVPPRLTAFRRKAASYAVRWAIESAAYALIPDPDDLLRSMLAESIDICAAWARKGASGVGVDDTAWAEACRLTAAVSRPG